MKKIIYIFIFMSLCAACSSVPKRPSLSQIQQFATQVISDLQARETAGTLSKEEQEEWKRLQEGMNSEEMLRLKKYSAQPINLEFPILVADANEWGYSFEEINDFLGLDLIVENPYCENEFKSYKVFQVLSDFVLADGCEVTSYDKCSTFHGRIFMFPKQGDELYFDNKILTPPSKFCSVYAGTYNYESKGGNSHTVPILLFLPKAIDREQLENIKKMREGMQKEQ
ncbi:hypothetical protein [Candidatus Avelusimicrobium alvi]|uniref:hypothetical protein n=1 Tax=Candidatus Avelusimicrobium alvi TaxID=3416221 RepID=UPI003D0C3248